MILFNAGVFTSNFTLAGRLFQRLTPHEQQHRLSVQWHLESYHYIHKQKFVDEIRQEGKKVFLDSGAFSAFTQGVKIDIGAYCDYIQRNADIVGVASVLDAIGDAEGTYRNQLEMERRGVRPLPCFHYGEPEALLDHYVANYDYITLGGMVPISTPQLRLWLDRLWEQHLTYPDGTPKIRVHGFGLTSLPLMKRYPWFSVDSSTWVQWAANGMILVPGVGQVNISARSSSRKIEGQHLDTLSSIERQAIEGKIIEYGGDPVRLREEYLSRWAFNLWAFPYYIRNKHWEGDRFIPECSGLF